jgi:hypothetical protein
MVLNGAYTNFGGPMKPLASFQGQWRFFLSAKNPIKADDALMGFFDRKKPKSIGKLLVGIFKRLFTSCGW